MSLGLKVEGLGFRVWSLGCRVPSYWWEKLSHFLAWHTDFSSSNKGHNALKLNLVCTEHCSLTPLTWAQRTKPYSPP